MKTWKDVVVGDTVWIRDENIRRYHVDGGRPTGSPIERECYRAVTVVAVEKFSIVTDYYNSKFAKIDRNTGEVRSREKHRGTLSATLDMENDVFVKENRALIVQMVQGCTDADVLRKVRELVRP